MLHLFAASTSVILLFVCSVAVHCGRMAPLNCKNSSVQASETSRHPVTAPSIHPAMHYSLSSPQTWRVFPTLFFNMLPTTSHFRNYPLSGPVLPSSLPELPTDDVFHYQRLTIYDSHSLFPPFEAEFPSKILFPSVPEPLE